VLGSIGSVLGELFSLKLPTLSWGFILSRNVEGLRIDRAMTYLTGYETEVIPVFGWVVTVLAFFFGLFLIVKFWSPDALTPLTRRRIERFKDIKRGYYSFLIILALGSLASLDQVLVGSEALAVKYEDQWSFPAFTRKIEKNKDYGTRDDSAEASADFRELQWQFSASEDGSKVVMPLWPYASTGDSISALKRSLKEERGVVKTSGGKPFQGLASRIYDPRKPEKVHMSYNIRKGIRQGMVNGWNEEGTRVYRARYEKGELVDGSARWSGEGNFEAFLEASPAEYFEVDRPPSGPSMSASPRHPLGTTTLGYDVVAYLFGGLKVNLQAALLYIPVVYAVGVSLGLLMGYFGGWFDLIVQRLIEILSNIPFLFLVMVISEAVPAQWKDRFGLYVILGILAIFGWMGMTYLMRTAALKEKARDYIAASRVLGASTPRILFKHLLPNSVAIVVTLIPFSVSGLVLSLASLDYLGFGLPAKYATWGKLLQDGLDHPSEPWLAASAFAALVSLLVLVTFVGEAVREAFDPKKFTYYR